MISGQLTVIVRLGAWFRRLLALVVVCILAGCATQAPVTPASSQAELVRFGRFALKADDFNRAPEAVQGGFTWRDNGTRLSLDLTDPFGSVMARVLVDRYGATLTRANGEVIQAASPDALMQNVLGQQIPVSELRRWLRTVHDAPQGMDVSLRDPDGRVQIFEQSGWRVQLSRFDEVGPRLLVITHSEGTKNIAIRLVIDTP